MPRLLRQVLIGLGVVVLQVLVLNRLRLWGAIPDAVLLFVVVQALRGGRLAGSVSGFAAGLLLDFLAYPATLGLNAVLKTIAGFVLGYFAGGTRGDLRIDPFLALVAGFVIAAFQNGIMVMILALDQGTRNAFMIFVLWLGGAAYTAFLAFLTSLFRRGAG